MGVREQLWDATSPEYRPSQGLAWVSIQAEQKAGAWTKYRDSVSPEVADVQPLSALEPALEEGWAPPLATLVDPGPSPRPQLTGGRDAARVPRVLHVLSEIQPKSTPCQAREPPTGVDRH